MCVVYARLQYVWFYANWARTLRTLPLPPPSQALYLTGQNKLAGWMTGWLASWPSRMLLYHANGMNHAYWSLVPTDWLTQTLSAAQLYRTELSWTELKSSRVESSQRCLLPSAGGASIVVVAVVDLSQHLFFSLALLTINKKRKCKRRKPNSIELKTENN